MIISNVLFNINGMALNCDLIVSCFDKFVWHKLSLPQVLSDAFGLFCFFFLEFYILSVFVFVFRNEVVTFFVFILLKAREKL